MLSALPSVAALVLGATSRPVRTAARLAPPTARAAAYFVPAAMTEVTAFTPALTRCDIKADLLGIGTARGEEPERRGSKRRASELYRVTA